MDREANLTGIIRRALASRGQRRVADLREALALAVELSGQGHPDKPGYYTDANRKQPVNNLDTIESLRGMLADPGIRDNGKAQAAIVRAIRAAQQ
jgi:hypothetical protein